MVRGFDLFGGSPQIYDRGNEFVPIVLGYTNNNTHANPLSKGSNSFTLNLSGLAGVEVTAVTDILLDLTNTKYVLVEVYNQNSISNASLYVVCSAQKNGSHNVFDARAQFSATMGMFMLDVGSLTGNFYVRLHWASGVTVGLVSSTIGKVLTINNP